MAGNQNKEKADEIIRLFMTLPEYDRRELVRELTKKISAGPQKGDNIAETSL